MERSWSLPVAQALQRHTGSWKASLPVDRDAGNREPEPISNTTNAALDGAATDRFAHHEISAPDRC
jgi:hypothetical protein